MPLLNRPDFLRWLADHREHSLELGEHLANRADCEACGSTNQTIIGEYCLVCLAGMFATDQTHDRIATAIRRAAATIADPDPRRLPDFVASALDRLDDLLDDASTS